MQAKLAKGERFFAIEKIFALFARIYNVVISHNEVMQSISISILVANF